MSTLTPFNSVVPTKPLKYVAALRGEKVDSVPTDGEYIGLEQIEPGTGRLSDIELQQQPEGAANVFEAGDVLFGKLRPYLAKGWTADRAGYCTTEALVLQPQSADSRFVRYCALSSEFIEAVNGSTYGSKMPRADWSFVGSVQIPCPSRSDQERIANFLDEQTARIDALIAEKERLREVLLESLSGAIELAVTAPADALQFSMPLKRVVTSLMTGPFGSALHSADYVDDGTPVINPAHIQNGQLVPDFQVSISGQKLQELESYQMSAGQLVVGRRGEMGRCAVVDSSAEGWLCGTGCLLVTPNLKKVLPKYLQLVVSSKRARDWLQLESVGSTMDNLNTEILGRLPGYFPSIEEQQIRCEQADKARLAHESLLVHVQRHVERLREYRSSLISAAVTGQLDLSTFKAAA